MKLHRYCDGVSRRDFLHLGALVGAGLTLPNYLRMASAGELKSASANAAIFINLTGGPSHIDSFDLKPDAPAEFRGEFNPIDTTVPGLQISEHLPKLAKEAQHFALLRGVSHSLAAHELGQKYMATGNRPLPSMEFPGYGSVAAKELKTLDDLPPYVAVPSTEHTAGYLGLQYNALSTGATPKPGQPFAVRGLALSQGITLTDINQRRRLLSKLDTAFSELDGKSALTRGLNEFNEKAFDMISNEKARVAFDVSKESPSLAEPFGPTPFGQSCLLAARLVEAGVRFVTVTMGGWDTHNDNFNKLKTQQLPTLDAGVASLLSALRQKGLLQKTTVFVTGEFGRTPKINTVRGGRDHWPRAMFCLLAGGGIKGGQVVGASDDKAMGPLNDAITPDSVAATFFHTLGIDHTKEYHSNTGRPIMVVRDGHVLPELLV
ncbi:MAG TPA: DUF1501 domain-containing protein [Pirellulales bacterium]